MTNIYNQNDFNLIASISFSVFLKKAFNETHPAENFVGAWYIDLICSDLERMNINEFSRLIINIAPRHLKSFICSVAWPAFLLGINPSTKIMCISGTDDLAAELALSCKTILTSDWYREIFPSTKLNPAKTAATDFVTTANGGRYATTLLGTVVGRGANWIIVDDPLQPKEAFSDIMRNKINKNFAESINTRFNDPAKGKIIVVMQRLHEHDLSGFIVSKDLGFKYLSLPAIATKDETFEIKNPFNGTFQTYSRKKGEVLNPERDTLDFFDYTKKMMGDWAFEAQYQQNPLPKGIGWLGKEQLHFYSGQLPMLEAIVCSWDTAGKKGENNSYSACVTIGIGKDKRYYVLDVFRGRLEFVELLNKVKEICLQYTALLKPLAVLIEDASSGSSLYQMLSSEIRRGDWSMRNLIPIKVHGSKEERFNTVLKVNQDQRLLLPNNSPSWYGNFEDELLSFPNSPYKDQCDALSQAIAFLENDTNRPIYQNTQVPLASNGRRVIGGKGSCPSFLLNPGCLSGIASRGGPVYSDIGIGTLACRGTYRPKPY